MAGARARWRACIAALLAWGCAAPLAWGCAGPAQLRYEEQVERTAPAAVHGVHERRLREQMEDLERLRFERLPKALDVDVEVARQVRELERVANAMAASAVELRAAAPAGLDAAEQAEFRRLASQLERRSESLARDAARLPPAQWRERLDGIDATCGSCHSRFRISRGSPDAG
jgi:hypothetical protein